MFDKRGFLILLALIIIIGTISSVSAMDSNVTDGDAYSSENNIEVVENSNINTTSQSDLLASGNVVYFDAYADDDGDGSQDNPYKYLYSDRITPGVTAYFKAGTYELNSTCIINGAKLIGERYSSTGSYLGTVINSKVPNDYDFIIMENSTLEMTWFDLNNFNILNHGTLIADRVDFEGNDLFDPYNLPEIQSGSGYFDSSFGGVIVCDTPANVMNTLVLKKCSFESVYGAFNGGIIAAINSNITISETPFMSYSANYMGGAIYCADSYLTIYDSWFVPGTVSDDLDFAINKFGSYTAYYGGSIFCEYCDVVLERIEFTGSKSFSFGGCIASFNSNVLIEDSIFSNSSSLADGGGAIYSSKGELDISDSSFNNNSAEFGGAICNLNSVLDVSYSSFQENSAKFYGGVIYDIYGTINLNYNHFQNSSALIGGAVYTRIPNDFKANSNSFRESYAEEGVNIFFDGKDNSSNLMIGELGNNNLNCDQYQVFVEFSATLDGEDYFIISNPLFYTLTSSSTYYNYLPFPNYEVSDGLVSMMIYNRDDSSRLTSLITNTMLHNVSADVKFSGRLKNPVLNFYVLEDTNIDLYCRGYPGNLYHGSREDLFRDYRLISSYSIDLQDKVLQGEFNFTETWCIQMGNDALRIDYNNLYEAGSFYPVSLINNTFLSSPSLPIVLPSYYSSNDYGLVSSVKDQKSGSNCWAFAGLATLETCLKKATGVTYDFSEENAKNLMAAYSVFGLKMETNYGGYDSMLMSYLTSWLGPIDESVEDYDDYSSISVQDNPMFHIQNIKFLPVRLDSQDNDMYKMAIMDYGAVSVTFKVGDDYHAVSLVGWDDDFTGKDSLGNLANGAWIFKNSYGSEWGDNGFGYLSYNQKLSEQLDPDVHAYTFVFEDVNPYTKVYQYDFAGLSLFYNYNRPIYYKNSFTAENESILSAFSTYFNSETNFTVMVYVNGQLVHSQDGVASAGYCTIPFNSFIDLNKGDEFAIVVNNHNLGKNYIPVCSAEEITKKTFNENVSFISFDGEKWFDLYDYADTCHVACIKAFTQSSDLKSIRMNVTEFTAIGTNNFNVKVSFDDFTGIKSINFCLVKFIVDGDVYYAQIKNGIASLNLNLANGVHSFYAQYMDNVYESNIVQFNFTVDASSSSNSFNALQDIINKASGSTVDLVGDYTYDELFDDGDYGVHVNKSVTINGNGHTINGLSKATAFYISANNVVLNDIVFNGAVSSNGGAVYISARNVTLNNCIFINCSATQYGGGIYSLFDISLNGCRFINNTADMGGALYLISTLTTKIRNSDFSNNFARIHGSAVYVSGIGSCSVSSTNFTSNNATYNGGAVFSSVYSIGFTDCIFSNNSAISGGAVILNSNINEFSKCIFLDNSAGIEGGAITSHNVLNVYDSDFINNAVTYYIAEDSYLVCFGGGAIYSFDDSRIYNCSFIGNHANSLGGAIYTNKYSRIFKSKFINNSAYEGGAIFDDEFQLISAGVFCAKFTEVRIYDSCFINNSAFGNLAGAIYKVDLVNNCTFENNHAFKASGAICLVKTIENSRFVNNSAPLAGAIYYEGVVPCRVNNSIFTNNNAANYGGVFYSYKYENDNDKFVSNILIYNSNFTNNSAGIGGGVVYSMGDMSFYNSSFINNSASDGGVIYLYNYYEYNLETKIYSCNFTDNRADSDGGAIVEYNAKCLIRDSSFNGHSSKYGSVIFALSDDKNGSYGVDIDSSNFTNNHALISGGAIYLNCEIAVSNSWFVENNAGYGGAIGSIYSNTDIYSNGDISSCHFTDNYASYSGGAVYFDGKCVISNTEFVDNHANYGGAIYSVSSRKEAMIFLNVSSCNFLDNSANETGGAITSAGKCVVFGSCFDENRADSGSTICAWAYLDLRNSTIKSSQNVPVYFNYNYFGTSLGDLYLKNNKIEVDGIAVYYDDDKIPYKLPLNIIFHNDSVVQGQKVLVCHLEDEDGNSFFGPWNLNITLIDQNNNIIKLGLQYDEDLMCYYLNTSQIPYATYKLSGKVSFSHPDNYIVKQGSLTVGDGSSKKHLVFVSSGLTKVYGNTNKLTVTLKDSNGNLVANTYITVYLNGKTSKLKTDSKGKASLAVSLAPKTYSAKISISGSDKCYPATKTVNVVIKKATPKITASKKTFSLKVKSKKYTITLKDNKGKAMKSTLLKIKVNGKTYSAKTNSKGQATFNINKLSKKGSFKSTITYAGSKYYNKVTKTVTLTVR